MENQENGPIGQVPGGTEESSGGTGANKNSRKPWQIAGVLALVVVAAAAFVYLKRQPSKPQVATQGGSLVASFDFKSINDNVAKLFGGATSDLLASLGLPNQLPSLHAANAAVTSNKPIVVE